MTETWRRYDPQQIEAQYNNRARVPEHPRIIDGWRARSQAYRGRHGAARLDLAYGEAPGERLDWFPGAAEPAPLHVFIHGGYWQTLDKGDFSFIAEFFNRAGIHCAVINYGLCPAVALDTIVRQATGALVWLRSNARQMGIDVDRIQISGHSAGAQLAAMCLCTQWEELDEFMPERLIHSAILVSGVYELEPLIGTSIDQALGLTPTKAQRNSPALRTPVERAPVLLAVGAEESEEFRRQANSLARCWAEVPIRSVELPGQNHFTIVDGFADPNGVLLSVAMRWLREDD